MRLGWILILLVIVLGGLIGTLIVRDPGYVLVAYGDYAWETSLWFALFVVVLLYVVVRIAGWLLRSGRHGLGSLGVWSTRRKTRRAREQTVHGLLRMAEGAWPDARRLLETAAPGVDTPIINYLNAARAANEMDDAEGRDALLREAESATPGARFAVGLTQASLQLDRRQYEQCLASLLPLQKQAPRHPRILRMLLDCYTALEDWSGVLSLIPDLRKQTLLDEPALRLLAVKAWRARLEADPESAFAELPKPLKKDAELVEVYARAEVSRGNADAAEAALRKALDAQFDDLMVTRYGQVQSSQVDRQLVVAEGWLKERPNNAALLLALGRICLMNKAWEKAREYFEASLRLEPTPAVYAELGRLCVAQGDLSRGSEYLKLATPADTELPLPDTEG